MSPNKDETVLYGCHYRGNMAVRMGSKVLATLRSKGRVPLAVNSFPKKRDPVNEAALCEIAVAEVLNRPIRNRITVVHVALACEQALRLGVWVFVGGGGGGRKRNESLQRCLTNLNVSVEKVCGKC